jgi:hypothetical protein
VPTTVPHDQDHGCKGLFVSQYPFSGRFLSFSQEIFYKHQKSFHTHAQSNQNTLQAVLGQEEEKLQAWQFTCNKALIQAASISLQRPHPLQTGFASKLLLHSKAPAGFLYTSVVVTGRPLVSSGTTTS